MKKKTFYTEAAYFIGLPLLAFGTALTAYGGFGMSMVVAPAYILHLFLSQFFDFFSFGVAEYVFQAFILIILMLVLRKAKLSFLLSFISTIFYGLSLDASTLLTNLLPQQNIALQITAYIIGIIICCASIALLFVTYLPLEAYEMFVKELSAKFKRPIHGVKFLYDCASLVVAIILCIVLLNPFNGNGILDVLNNFMACGIGIGTVVCTFIFGYIIRLSQNIYLKLFKFKDKFKFRKYFEESEETQ